MKFKPNFLLTSAIALGAFALPMLLGFKHNTESAWISGVLLSTFWGLLALSALRQKGRRAWWLALEFPFAALWPAFAVVAWYGGLT
jgi:hypothetical protein